MTDYIANKFRIGPTWSRQRIKWWHRKEKILIKRPRSWQESETQKWKPKCVIKENMFPHTVHSKAEVWDNMERLQNSLQTQLDTNDYICSVEQLLIMIVKIGNDEWLQCMVTNDVKDLKGNLIGQMNQPPLLLDTSTRAYDMILELVTCCWIYCWRATI